MPEILALKEMLLTTAEIHEKSGLSKIKTHQGELQMNISLQAAAKQACGNDALWFPIWLLLHLGWNDALLWADDPQKFDCQKG